MQLTLHATRRTPQGASRLAQAMSAWSVKPGMLHPSIVGMRGSMALRTTAMHGMSSSPPPGPRPDNIEEKNRIR